jgi:dsDNA-specific endonuclease/ATPase MutS2
MAELTNLETKLGEVLGLAMAAQGATEKVKKLDDLDDDLANALDRMHDEAKQAEERAMKVAGDFRGKKTAILDEAREVKQKATEMMRDYLDAQADALDGFEFLTMAEAGEVGHWAIVEKLNEQARDPQIGELVEWVLPIQLRHYETVLAGSVKLAGAEDPNAIES